MTDMNTTIEREEITRSARLKTNTHESHDRLDARVSNSGAFESLDHYGKFLAVQWRFHKTIAPLYNMAELAAALPDLKDRQRLSAIEADMADLGMPLPEAPKDTPLGDNPTPATAWGWLYVAEGSNLGAAVLLKRVRQIGLSEEHGARHLVGSDEGRGLHWRRFKSALDGTHMTAEDEQAMYAGADNAFDHVRALVEQEWARG